MIKMRIFFFNFIFNLTVEVIVICFVVQGVEDAMQALINAET